MMRILFILFIIMLGLLLVLNGRLIERDSEKPVFLRVDETAALHHTEIKLFTHGIYHPYESEMEVVKKDFSSLWAHLNHLYATNDVETGKEYYTEYWFKQICDHYQGIQEQVVSRIDLKHELHINNWAWDGLAYTAIDSNVVFQYQYNDRTTTTTRADIALIMLFQGDHWRIDAMKIMNECIINPIK
jgi:hypothetical protein